VKQCANVVKADPLAPSAAGRLPSPRGGLSQGRRLRGWLRLGAYHLRLALHSLRQDPGLSLAMLICLALGSGMWTSIVGHHLREFPLRPALSPALAHVELYHPSGVARFAGTRETEQHARLRVSFPEYQILAGSGIPARQAGSFRAQLLVAPGITAPAHLRHARFADADLFDLFDIPVTMGRAYSRADQTARAPVAVIGGRLAVTLFGDPAHPDAAVGLGKTLVIEGHPFTVIGVVGKDQPFRPEWDVVAVGGFQDGLYLPLSWAEVMRVWPDRALMQTPVDAPRGDNVWQSSTIFVSFWAELVDQRQRLAYADYLGQRLPPAAHPRLRMSAEWAKEFPPLDSDIVFFTLVLALGLAGAGFSTARLLLAKGHARREELGIHRALGATRGDLFARQMIEAALIALPAALIGPVIAIWQHRLFNTIALVNDIPVGLDVTSAVIGVGAAFLVGLVAAAYPAWRMSRTPPTVTMGRL
jgi:putative ABC transport system permease protein